MLTYLLAKLGIAQHHWVQRKLGIQVGMHEWLHGFCPCQFEADLDEDTLDEGLEAA